MPRAAALVAALVCVAATAAMAGSVKFADLCPGYRFAMSKKGDLLVYCPGQAEPWMTFPACAKPRVTSDSDGNLTVTCG